MQVARPRNKCKVPIHPLSESKSADAAARNAMHLWRPSIAALRPSIAALRMAVSRNLLLCNFVVRSVVATRKFSAFFYTPHIGRSESCRPGIPNTARTLQRHTTTDSASPIKTKPTMRARNRHSNIAKLSYQVFRIPLPLERARKSVQQRERHPSKHDHSLPLQFLETTAICK